MRCAAALEAARDRQRGWLEQGSRLVAAAEADQTAAIAALVRAMGSTQIAASVLDLDNAVVRKAVTLANRRTRLTRSAPGVTPTSRPTGPVTP
jgi:hypothetical protein